MVTVKGELFRNKGASQSSEGSNSIGETHKDCGIAGRNVQVVHVETYKGCLATKLPIYNISIGRI